MSETPEARLPIFAYWSANHLSPVGSITDKARLELKTLGQGQTAKIQWVM